MSARSRSSRRPTRTPVTMEEADDAVEIERSCESYDNDKEEKQLQTQNIYLKYINLQGIGEFWVLLITVTWSVLEGGEQKDSVEMLTP